jgi:hypothetical protein
MAVQALVSTRHGFATGPKNMRPFSDEDALAGCPSMSRLVIRDPN